MTTEYLSKRTEPVAYSRNLAGLTIRQSLLARNPRKEIEGMEETVPLLTACVKAGRYSTNPPLIKPSKITTKKEGGIGKELSNDWALNFAVGCTYACVFCYLDSIHKRYGENRYGDIIKERWGNYFLTPSNIDEAIELTPWSKWRGQEVTMSSTHDP